MFSIVISHYHLITGRVEVKIPQMIDDYNFWMGGVDKADQLIAYYLPDLRCHRNWLPMFIQLLAIIRVNSYLILKQTNDVIKADSHYTGKRYAVELLDVYLRRVNMLQHENNSVPDTSSYEEVNAPKVFGHKRRLDNIFSTTTRFDLPESIHKLVTIHNSNRIGCVWCKYIHNRKQLESKECLKYVVTKTKKQCSHCNVSICGQLHMYEFHNNHTLPMDKILVRGRYSTQNPDYCTTSVENAFPTVTPKTKQARLKNDSDFDDSIIGNGNSDEDNDEDSSLTHESSSNGDSDSSSDRDTSSVSSDFPDFSV